MDNESRARRPFFWSDDERRASFLEFRGIAELTKMLRLSLSARDNGINVIVGVRKDGESWRQAMEDGWVSC